MSIVRFIKPSVFECEATEIMSAAFDAACKELHDTGQPDLVLEVARRIIELARTSELDLVRLREAALVGLMIPAGPNPER